MIHRDRESFTRSDEIHKGLGLLRGRWGPEEIVPQTPSGRLPVVGWNQDSQTGGGNRDVYEGEVPTYPDHGPRDEGMNSGSLPRHPWGNGGWEAKEGASVNNS